MCFRGRCLLFSEGQWQEEDGQLLVSWASRFYCNYVIFVGVLLFIVSSVQLYRLSSAVLRDADASFLGAFVEAAGCAALCTACLAAAAAVTLGLITWCRNIMERFPSCKIADGLDIDKKDQISTNGFYVEMGTAQFGAWGAFATCVGLTVFSTLKLCRYHQLENIRVSMYRERQRLVNEAAAGAPSPERCSTPPVAVAAHN
ncbi:Transmembrane protein 179 [Eumeta japonica]|uniref:Transmembrane protein 179 n=1 Tax=Eumeta variegata TaxID=151549 RepID=A0A4C1WFK6_EUMVA|nr:Transmembrane protein 179 [Eumeta japonica]